MFLDHVGPNYKLSPFHIVQNILSAIYQNQMIYKIMCIPRNRPKQLKLDLFLYFALILFT